MSVSKKDDNGYAAWCGISCVDCVTPTRITIDPVTKGMMFDNMTVISCTPSSTFQHNDDNGYPVISGVSSTDSNTVLPLYVNPSDGSVLVDIIP